MTLDASGNLGVGTTSPTARLQINGTTDATQRIIVGGTGNTSSYKLNYNGSEVGFIQNYQNTELDIGTAVTAPIIFYVNNSEKTRIASSGELLVATTSVYGVGVTIYTPDSGGSYSNATSTAARNHWRFANANGAVGSIQTSASLTLYNTTSDYRLKTVIGAVTGQGARIDALEPIEYEWKADQTRTRGFLAHKFQEVYSSSVSGTKDAVDENGKPVYQAMQAGTAEVIADLVAEIQSLRVRVAQLETN
jgi:hypothetical protein